jgi:hypothetical protein
MAFERWKYPWPKSWAHHVFKRHHTQLNAMWWAHHAASRHAATTAHNVGLSERTIQAFPAAIIHPSRKDLQLDEWLGYYKGFDNWVRLSACLSMCSYFEHYLHRTIRLALASDPGILLGKPRAIDGASYLKSGASPIDFKPHIEAFIKGTWPSRIASYERLFGVVPRALNDNLAELERIRELRNKVGHRFGRAIVDLDIRPEAGLEEAERLSEERLAKWLGVVEKSVVAIDDHLRSAHIGAYEVLEAYAEVKKDLFSKVWRDRRLVRYFPATNGDLFGTRYSREAIAYFDSL